MRCVWENQSSGKIKFSEKSELTVMNLRPYVAKTYINIVSRQVSKTMNHKVDYMFHFQLDSLSSKELYRDVLVRLVNGNELVLNYFELKNENVELPFHEHPVEHLVVVLEGIVKFIFEDSEQTLKKKDCIFVPAKKRHTARVLDGPVKALEVYAVAEDEYYKR